MPCGWTPAAMRCCVKSAIEGATLCGVPSERGMNMELPSRGQTTSWWHIHSARRGGARRGVCAAGNRRSFHHRRLARRERPRRRHEWLACFGRLCRHHSWWTVGGSTDASYNSTPTLLATTDGGAHRNAESVGGLGSDDSLESIHFIDRNDGWVVGENDDGGFILATTDGGLTWTHRMPASRAAASAPGSRR